VFETVDRLEPTRLEAPTSEIVDLVAEIAFAATRLGHGLHPRTAAQLAGLVRIMNTYYSNLIEGHDTRPREIERALVGEFEVEGARRDLQIEAAAHVRVQGEIDAQAAAGSLPEPASREYLCGLHRAFYRDAPESALLIRGGRGTYVMVPGEFRSSPAHDNVVGLHLPPSSARVDDFMRYFEQRYALRDLGTGARILAIPIAHHRFNYIHPFPDGNGRVSRLMSHATAHAAGIGAHGLWSVSRGLARGRTSRADYKRMMDRADAPRENDFDGRGNLSRRALIEFVTWFLEVMLDQLRFMTELFALETLGRRLRSYVEKTGLRPEAAFLLEEALVRGEFERGAAARITRTPERTARRILADVIAAGLLASETAKGPLSLRFPVRALDVVFPRLFAEL